jgi:ABC-type multidrug transport system ATPase subunit
LTIHQPNSEIYALFDKLMLISEGKFVFQGEANKAISYFADKFNLKCPEY